MPYIPVDWLVDKKKEAEVHKILDKHLISDINLDIDPAIKELKAIGETTVARKLAEGVITID